MDVDHGMIEPRSSIAVEGGPPPAEPPHRVRLPVNMHHWERIAFLHWPFDPAVVSALLPDGLRVLTHRGAAWVSVTPFVMTVRLPGLPPLRPVCQFPETNLRTYVEGPDGRQGIWFLRMEVASRWFATSLRLIGLPYVRHSMSVDVDDGMFRYRSNPTPEGAGGHEIDLRPGATIEPPGGDETDRFLTARWVAFHRPMGGAGPLLRTPVDHGRWNLQTAELQHVDVTSLFLHAGLPDPPGPPLAHVSPGVEVRVGLARPA